MGRIVGEILVLVLGLFFATGQQAQDKPATPAEQYKAILKEYHDARADIAKAKTDEQRKRAHDRRDRLPPRFLELAEKNPRDPIVVDALFDMVWFGMPGSEEAPKPLPKAIVEAWTELGANVCWLRVDELGFVKVIPTKEGKPGDLPGFNFVHWQEGWLAKLPAPDAAFGLHLGRTEVSDAGLKELARYKSLQALSVDVTRVTDGGLKELAGLQSLQSLSLAGDQRGHSHSSRLAGQSR